MSDKNSNTLYSNGSSLVLIQNGDKQSHVIILHSKRRTKLKEFILFLEYTSNSIIDVMGMMDFFAELFFQSFKFPFRRIMMKSLMTEKGDVIISLHFILPKLSSLIMLSWRHGNNV
jgi:hypothetical protein